jgi:hypothetical protein
MIRCKFSNENITAISVALLILTVGACIAQTPLNVYKSLGLPETVRETGLHKGDLKTIHAGPLVIQLESTPLAAVQKQLGGTIASGGDASTSVSWFCYAGMNAEKKPVIS